MGSYRNRTPRTFRTPSALFMGKMPMTRSQAYSHCLKTGRDVVLLDYGADPVVKYCPNPEGGGVLVKETTADHWAVATPEGVAAKPKPKPKGKGAPKGKGRRREVAGYTVKGLLVPPKPNKGAFLEYVRRAQKSNEGRCKLQVAKALTPYGVRALCHYKDGGVVEFLAN